MASMPDLSDRKLPELKELAESLGVPKARYLRKPELLEAIQQLSERGGTSSAPATDSVDAPAQEGRRRGRPARTESQSGEAAANVAGEANSEGERPLREDRPRREGWEDRGARSERSDRGPREEREPRSDRDPREDRAPR
ncbi:MAG: Rho termination factor N-terminal domain-containing protein, partial [Schleiferiaceae bacterium]